MPLLRIALFFLATAWPLAGCGVFKTKQHGAKQKQTDTNLAGTWRSGCSRVAWLGLASKVETIQISALGDFDRTTTLYTDNACQSAAGALTVSGTFDTLGADSKASGSDDINFTITSAAMTPGSDSTTKLLNATAYCETSTWKTGQAVDILDHSCAGKTLHKGSVTFDIYRLDNDNKNLTFGRNAFFLESLDAGSRPGAIDSGQIFLRQ